jgi:hypothetical protein
MSFYPRQSSSYLTGAPLCQRRSTWALGRTVMTRNHGGIPLLIPLLFPPLVVLQSQSPWIPPANPNADKIFNEIRQDFKDKKYQTALEKHVWFHKNALKFNQGMYGVRLSYAIAEWIELGRVYPPALSALQKIRDDSCSEIKSGRGDFYLFNDISSINEYLHDEDKTALLFVFLKENNANLAKQVYPLAQSSLIQAKKYSICNEYISPKQDIDMANHLLNVNLELAKKPEFGQQLKKFAEDQYSTSISTLVAIMVVNNRTEEAGLISIDALKHLDSPGFRKMLADAKQGVFPSSHY